MQSENRQQKNKYKTYFYFSLCVALLLACALAYSIIGTKNKTETKNSITNVTDDSAIASEVPTASIYEKSYTSTPPMDDIFSFPDYDKNSKEAEMQRVFVALDNKTRMILNYIQKGELEKIRNVFAVDYKLTDEGKILFQEMDYPTLAISSDMVQSSYPLNLTNGTQQDNHFTFYYLLLHDESHTQLFVQYKKIDNEWLLVNIRTNH